MDIKTHLENQKRHILAYDKYYIWLFDDFGDVIDEWIYKDYTKALKHVKTLDKAELLGKYDNLDILFHIDI